MKKFQIKEEKLNEASWDIKDYGQFVQMLWDVANKAGDFKSSAVQAATAYGMLVVAYEEELKDNGIELSPQSKARIAKIKDLFEKSVKTFY